MILIIIIGTIAGIANAIQDTIAHHFMISIFWRLKNVNYKMYKWFESDWTNKPEHEFWFTWDGWHFFKTLEQASWLLGIYFGAILIDVAIFGAAYMISFNLFYHEWLLDE